VRTILAGWYRAARSTGETQRVRALLFFAEQAWEFRWEQDVLYRVFTDEESRPATAREWEMLSQAVSYGWLLVYLMEGEGREARVLHQIGTRVPAQRHHPEDLPLLLQEPAPLPGSAAVSPHSEPERAAEGEQEGASPSSSPSSRQGLLTDAPLAVNQRQGRRARKARRPLAALAIGAESSLLLGSIWVLTRNPWFCLGTLALLATLVLVLRRLCRPRTGAGTERAQQQVPSSNR